jgi:uncharacterized protein (TIGR02246 family)
LSFRAVNSRFIARINPVDSEKKVKNASDLNASAKEPAGKDAGAARKTMGDSFVPRIDYALRARLAKEAEQGSAKDPIAAALRSAEHFDVETDAEQIDGESDLEFSDACRACGKRNPPGTHFCSGCGVPLEAAPRKSAPWDAPQSGQHHYHHHYHHHYFGQEQSISQERAPISATVARESSAQRTPLSGTGLSKAEAAVRKLNQDWAQACNTKHLDDLVDLYATDALVLRPNVPAVRGTAAIREFLFSILDAGLGEVEMEVVRVEIFGDVAYEAGRCKMLVPTALGKRREERGKYLLVATKQAGEWKIATDCWSSDLSLDAEGTSPSPVRTARK